MNASPRIRRLATAWVARAVCIGACAWLIACASIDLPGTDASRAAIARLDSACARADSAVRAALPALPDGNDVIVRVRIAALNRIAQAVAGNRSDDVRLVFPPTRPLFAERKSVLGIAYDNVLDIDTGAVVLDLRTLRFDRAESGRIDARLVVEGGGAISVSGRSMGVGARASPDVRLALDEVVTFTVSAGDSGRIVLAPQHRPAVLHCTFAVTLLGWKIPFSKDLPFDVADLVKPIVLPAGVAFDLPVRLPLHAPADSIGRSGAVPSGGAPTGDDGWKFPVLTRGAHIVASGNAIELRSDLSFDVLRRGQRRDVQPGRPDGGPSAPVPDPGKRLR